ncbi:hypothetical protein GCM10018793_23120 [Streptomyces sulfonofaciens]|uniref:Uncharacterized protein n=1 Tax=Streptomyces sulfonofaciens TaxID=68272 RepID=A0A919G3B7_9ACTN|nr:hypothetical protein GCM10018793_23120 [Streptomyces sulfonofaciens]
MGFPVVSGGPPADVDGGELPAAPAFPYRVRSGARAAGFPITPSFCDLGRPAAAYLTRFQRSNRGTGIVSSQ